ncbi:hypothetical protein BLNAU_19697 [Blattamonas nauphoetae]|uniref:Uncharacterized protein n=1 Tax=Blattamonas nauphoetae TaxID=2049346 RepID=A0ABQ9X0R5_9EUKA|nr:hypothetical protein BLNAU_19697 [Blattamonas nauphoetae]
MGFQEHKGVTPESLVPLISTIVADSRLYSPSSQPLTPGIFSSTSQTNKIDTQTAIFIANGILVECLNSGTFVEGHCPPILYLAADASSKNSTPNSLDRLSKHNWPTTRPNTISLYPTSTLSSRNTITIHFISSQFTITPDLSVIHPIVHVTTATHHCLSETTCDVSIGKNMLSSSYHRPSSLTANLAGKTSPHQPANSKHSCTRKGNSFT